MRLSQNVRFAVSPLLFSPGDINNLVYVDIKETFILGYDLFYPPDNIIMFKVESEKELDIFAYAS